MSDSPTGTTTAAERCIRAFFAEGEEREADLCVLALERALIREGHDFEFFSGPDDTTSRQIGAGDPVPSESRVHVASDEVGAQINHVADWIKTSCQDEAGWLSRLDGEGRPVKLTKIGSLDRAMAEADKAMRRAASRMTGIALAGEDEEVHADLGDGWSLVRLLSPAALDRESGFMGHCIGQGAYDARLRDPHCMFLSLRDPAGRPHATLEIVSNPTFRNGPDGASSAVPPPSKGFRVAQLQGKQNGRPVEKHLRRIRPWLRENARVETGRQGPGDGYEWWSGFLPGPDGGRVDVMSLPARTRLRDPIVFHLGEGDVLPSDFLSSPSAITIEIAEGRVSPVLLPDVVESGAEVRLVGPGTFVFGSRFEALHLRASGCTFRSVPDRLEVRRTTILENVEAGTFPAASRPGILSLPGSAARFEDGFETTSLDLTHSKVDSLPQRMRADRLVIAGGEVEEIPDGSRIQLLHASGTTLRRMGRIEGLQALDLLRTSSDLVLPDELEVALDVRMDGPTFPATMPRRLRVGGTLRIEQAHGVVLPKDLDVARMVVIDSRIGAIPSGTKIRKLLQLVDAGGIDVGEDCEFGDIVVIGAADAKEAGRPPYMRSIDPNPAISRIEGDGTFETRNMAPSM